MIWVWTVPHRLMCWNTCSLFWQVVEPLGGISVWKEVGFSREFIEFLVYAFHLLPILSLLMIFHIVCMYIQQNFFLLDQEGLLCPPPFFTPIPFLSFPACASAFTVHGHDPDFCLSSLGHSGLLCVCTDSALLKGIPSAASFQSAFSGHASSPSWAILEDLLCHMARLPTQWTKM